MSWGRKPSCECGACRKCRHREYMRQYRASMTFEERRRVFVDGRDKERVRRNDRERHHRMKDDPAYQARRRAVFAVNNAIRDGRLERGSCEVCGKPHAHGHHDDYSKPLEVRWLCPQHHAAEHKQAEQAAT